MSEVYIYALCDPTDDDAVRYVGRTEDLRNRIAVHLADARYPRQRKSPVNRWVREKLDAGTMPLVRILEKVVSSQADTREIYYITHYATHSTQPLLNVQHAKRAPKALSPKRIATGKQFTIRVTADEYERVEQMAKGDERQVTDMARRIFRDGFPVRISKLRARGISIPEDATGDDDRD